MLLLAYLNASSLAIVMATIRKRAQCRIQVRSQCSRMSEQPSAAPARKIKSLDLSQPSPGTGVQIPGLMLVGSSCNESLSDQWRQRGHAQGGHCWEWTHTVMNHIIELIGFHYCCLSISSYYSFSESFHYIDAYMSWWALTYTDGCLQATVGTMTPS